MEIKHKGLKGQILRDTNKYYIVPYNGDLIVSKGSGVIYKVCSLEVTAKDAMAAIAGDPITIRVEDMQGAQFEVYLNDLLDKRAYVWYRRLQ